MRFFKRFDILYPDTWKYASKDRPFSWDGVPLFMAKDSPISEHDISEFFKTMFAFLERDGRTIPLEKKQHGIRTVLGRMKISNAQKAIIDQQRSWSRRIDYQDQSQEHYKQARVLFERGDDFYDELSKSRMLQLLSLKQSDVKYVRAVCRMPCRRQCVFPDRIAIDEALRNPIIPKHDALDTWYFDYDDPEEAIASGEIIGFCHGEWEESNALLDAAMAKLKGRQDAWGEAVAKLKGRQDAWGAAVAKARAEFENRGINDPGDNTPGYLERINVLFQEIYSTSPVNDGGKRAEDLFKKNM